MTRPHQDPQLDVFEERTLHALLEEHERRRAARVVAPDSTARCRAAGRTAAIVAACAVFVTGVAVAATTIGVHPFGPDRNVHTPNRVVAIKNRPNGKTCLQAPLLTGSGTPPIRLRGVRCFTAAEIADGRGIVAYFDRPRDGAVTVWGLVPDGVPSVTFGTGRATRTAAVTDNVWSADHVPERLVVPTGRRSPAKVRAEVTEGVRASIRAALQQRP